MVAIRHGFIYVAQESPRLDGQRSGFVIPSPGATGEGLVKIGFTTKPPLFRLGEVSSQTRRTLNVLGLIRGTPQEEARILERLSYLRADTPWGFEWFYPTIELFALAASMPIGACVEEWRRIGMQRVRVAA